MCARKIAAWVAGVAVFLVWSVILSFVSVFVWGHDPDRYASTLFLAWATALSGLLLADVVRQKIAPFLFSPPFFAAGVGVIIFILVAIWVPFDPHYDHALLFLLGHTIGTIGVVRVLSQR